MTAKEVGPEALLETCRMRIPVLRDVPEAEWKAVSLPRRRRPVRLRPIADPLLDRIVAVCILSATLIQALGASLIALT